MFTGLELELLAQEFELAEIIRWDENGWRASQVWELLVVREGKYECTGEVEDEVFDFYSFQPI